MAFSAAGFTHSTTSFSTISSTTFSQSLRRVPPSRLRVIRAVESSLPPPPENEKASATQPPPPPAQQASSSAPKTPLKKPVYSMKKGQIVRVDKNKYLNSVNYLSVGHPPYYKGLDYIYEDRGEVLDIRIFDTGEYALIAWVGVPTAPAWLPTDMLIKSEKLNYERI